MPTSTGCELPSTEELLGAHAGAVRDQANALCQLEPGWDLADAPRIAPEAAINAVRLAMKVTCPECLAPTLSPTRAGNVLVDWTWGPEHVEVEVFADGRIEVLVNVGSVTGEFETTISNDLHLQWLAYQVTGVGISRLTPPG